MIKGRGTGVPGISARYRAWLLVLAARTHSILGEVEKAGRVAVDEYGPVRMVVRSAHQAKHPDQDHPIGSACPSRARSFRRITIGRGAELHQQLAGKIAEGGGNRTLPVVCIVQTLTTSQRTAQRPVPSLSVIGAG